MIPIAIIFVIATGIFTYLVVKLLPHFILKLKSTPENTYDRGIKKWVFDDGRAVVYEPELKYRRFVKEYLLIAKNHKKYIKCLVDERIKHIRYDVLVFNNKNKLVDIVAVDEKMNKSKYTSTVLLPSDTSYVSLVLREVDDMFSSREKRAVYTKVSFIVYMAIVTLLSVFEGILLRYMLREIWQFTIFEPVGTVKMVIWSAIIGAVCSLLILNAYRVKNIKVTNR